MEQQQPPVKNSIKYVHIDNKMDRNNHIEISLESTDKTTDQLVTIVKDLINEKK